MTKYTWKIDNMTRMIDNDFVIQVKFSVLATDGQYVASTDGFVGCEQTEESFTPYENLTEEQVLQWVYDSVGKQKFENYLDSQIARQKNPTVVSGLPWNQVQ